MIGRTRKLTADAQRFVVCGLACFEKPTAVTAALKKEFGIAVTAQTVEAYDPTKRAGRRLSKQWRDLFETSRETFLRETAEIGIAHKTQSHREEGRSATVVVILTLTPHGYPK